MRSPTEIGPHVISERQIAAFAAVLADTPWAERFRARFFARIHPEPTSGCHLWSAANKNGGYGFQTACMSFGKVPLMAHRLAMAFDSGFMPDGHTVNHRCNNTACVNPRHLYVGTQQDNVRDEQRAGVFAARRAA